MQLSASAQKHLEKWGRATLRAQERKPSKRTCAAAVARFIASSCATICAAATARQLQQRRSPDMRVSGGASRPHLRRALQALGARHVRLRGAPRRLSRVRIAASLGRTRQRAPRKAAPGKQLMACQARHRRRDALRAPGITGLTARREERGHAVRACCVATVAGRTSNSDPRPGRVRATMSSIAVIMVGGPTTSNFRALGSVPAPLFPIAGRALLHHPITAAAAVPGITAVYVLGFYEERDFAPYLATMSAEVGVPVRYLCESRGHGSAGGLHQFRDTLLQEDPGSMFLLNCDVCCAFPLVGAFPLTPRRARVCAEHAPLSAATHAAAARCRAGAGAASHAAAPGASDRDRSAPLSPARRREHIRRQRAPGQRTLRLPAAMIAPGVRSALHCTARKAQLAAMRARCIAARRSAVRLSPHGTSPAALRRAAGRAPCAPVGAGHHAGQARAGGQGARVRRGGCRRSNGRAAALHRAPRNVRAPYDSSTRTATRCA